MKLLIDIPEEFEGYFSRDRFEDTLIRLKFENPLASLHDHETIDMLVNTFREAKEVAT